MGTLDASVPNREWRNIYALNASSNAAMNQTRLGALCELTERVSVTDQSGIGQSRVAVQKQRDGAVRKPGLGNQHLPNAQVGPY